jgi:hypothetical protein
MPFGKPAGIPCVHLTDTLACTLFGKPERPSVCVSLKPEPLMCGQSQADALEYLGALELLTQSK